MALATSAAQAAFGEARMLLAALWTSAVQPDSVAASLSVARPLVARDVAVFGIFALAFFSLTWGVRLLVEPLLRLWQPKMKLRVVQKFSQSVTEVLFYGGFTVLGLAVVPQQAWAWPSASWWVAGDVAQHESEVQALLAAGGAKPGFDAEAHGAMRADLRCYYILYAARYFQAGISVLLEHKRKDFAEMVIHHWVTVALLFLSYGYGWNRVGAIIMVIMDPADVPLHLAKICKYLSDAGGRCQGLWQTSADWLFVLFALVFFSTRLVCYPYVCWSCQFESERYVTKSESVEWYPVALLYVLLGLQVYWFGLLLRVAVKLLATGAAEDVRSDDEDGEEDPSASEAVPPPRLLSPGQRQRLHAKLMSGRAA